MAQQIASVRTLVYIMEDGGFLCHKCIINKELPLIFTYPEYARDLPVEEQQWAVVGVQEFTYEGDNEEAVCSHCYIRFPIASYETH